MIIIRSGVYSTSGVISMNEKSYLENLKHLYEKRQRLKFEKGRRGEEQRVIKIGD